MNILVQSGYNEVTEILSAIHCKLLSAQSKSFPSDMIERKHTRSRLDEYTGESQDAEKIYKTKTY